MAVPDHQRDDGHDGEHGGAQRYEQGEHQAEDDKDQADKKHGRTRRPEVGDTHGLDPPQLP
jgi:hypothetical protein